MHNLYMGGKYNIRRDLELEDNGSQSSRPHTTSYRPQVSH